jgi:C4-dicarboxylate-specific signal transduction histidine kinase
LATIDGLLHRERKGIHHLVRKSADSRQLINVNDVVADVLRLLHSDFVGRGISTQTEYASELLSVAADPVHLQQVIMNLLLNSLEAMRSTAAAARFT